MNLAVRGRRVFKRRNQKYGNSDEPEPKSENKENKTIKTSNTSPLLRIAKTAKPESPNGAHDFSNYQGPIIGDLIEELHKTYFQNADISNSVGNGISFARAVKPTSSLDTKKHRNLPQTSGNIQGVSRRECFVNKRNSNNNKSVSLNRNGNITKESGKKTEKVTKQKSKSFSGVGLLKEWKQKSKKIAVKGNVQSGNEVWEKETASILKGKTILSKSNFNKNYVRNNKLSSSCEYLPQLKISSKINNFVKPDLVTVGLRLKTGKSKNKNNLLNLS